jgi:cysteine desulfurase / selenocysteine lyase
MSQTSTSLWQQFRERMPATKRLAYFDHAAVAPLSGPASEAIGKWLVEATEEGGPAWPRWERRLQEVRRVAATMVGAKPEEIALVRSTTDGITLVAEGLAWQPGENVVLSTDEFPSNQYPWLNLQSRGVEVRRVEAADGRLDLHRLMSACDGRTRIIAISWVGFLSGWRIDLATAAETAHRRGALLLVDAIQGLGAFPLDVARTPIDFFAADGHKWMLGPEGAGLLYIRREHLNRLRPLGVGWNSVASDLDFAHIEFRLKDSAERYEGGSPNSVGFAGLGASLELLSSLGIDAIGRRILEIIAECHERLSKLGATVYSALEPEENRSGILTFEFPGLNSLAMKRHCLSKGVVLSHRTGKLRISPHAYVNHEDIDRLTDALTEAKRDLRQ